MNEWWRFGCVMNDNFMEIFFFFYHMDDDRIRSSCNNWFHWMWVSFSPPALAHLHVNIFMNILQCSIVTNKLSNYWNFILSLYHTQLNLKSLPIATEKALLKAWRVMRWNANWEKWKSRHRNRNWRFSVPWSSYQSIIFQLISLFLCHWLMPTSDLWKHFNNWFLHRLHMQ